MVATGWCRISTLELPHSEMKGHAEWPAGVLAQWTTQCPARSHYDLRGNCVCVCMCVCVCVCVCVCDAEATFFGFSYCILAPDVAFLSSCSQEQKMFWYKCECVVRLRGRYKLKQSGLKKSIH